MSFCHLAFCVEWTGNFTFLILSVFFKFTNCPVCLLRILLYIGSYFIVNYSLISLVRYLYHPSTSNWLRLQWSRKVNQDLDLKKHTHWGSRGLKIYGRSCVYCDCCFTHCFVTTDPLWTEYWIYIYFRVKNHLSVLV